MGMGTTITTLCKNTLFFKIALLCLVLYSLRSDVLVKCDDGGVIRSSEYARMVGRRRNGWSSSSSSPKPSPVWRRNKVVHRRHSSTPSTSTEASVEISSSMSPDPNIRPLLPDDFINLASSNSAGIGPSSESDGVLPSSSFFPTAQSQKIFADPFMLVGEDNILGPTPTVPRRKIYRRTRRRRIKKLRGEAGGGGRGGSTSTLEPASSSTITEEEVTGEEFGSTTSASTESLNKYNYLTTKGSSSTERPTLKSSTSTTTMKLAVIPIDSLMQGQTAEISTEGFSQTTGPTAAASPTGMNNIKPGFYTGHQKGGKGGGRKRAKSKENLWIAPVIERAPNFSVELFDNTDTTDELNNSNLGKRESSKSNTSPAKNYNMFALKPTALSSLLNEGDMSTGESIANPYVNSTLPISTELQNSLQFTLQNLHPLLNSDSVLTQNTPKIPENKTVAITHTLAEGSGDTPIAPDLRFLPAHLRKSHPLLSEETFLNGGFGGGIGASGSKVGPRLNVYPGLHSMRNKDENSQSSTSTTERNKGQFSSTFKSVVSIPSTLRTPTRVGGTVSTSSSTTTTTSTEPSTTSTTRKTTTSTSTRLPTSPAGKVQPTPAQSNVHLESLGNLKITEIVYPTKTIPPPPPPPKSSVDDLKSYATPPEIPSSTTTTSASTRKTSSTTTSASTTRKSTTTKKASAPSSSPAAPPASSSGRPTPYFDDKHSPPLILMGSDSTMGSTIESPPAFDDLLLEELIKGFEPPKPSTTTKATTTTTTTTTTPRPTTTTRKTTTTTTTTTTPKPTTTTRRTTTTTTTTTTPPPPPPPPTQPPKLKLSPQQQQQEDEAQQLIQLLNLLQANQQQPLSTTTEGLKSSSTSTASSTTSTSSSTTLNPTKLDDDFLKNLALLENLLSPTAKTMIKEAVDAGTTEKIKSTSPSANGDQGLSNADLHKIFAMLDAMSSTTPRPTTTTTTTPKPAQVMHPALQNMLNMLTNPMQSVQKPVFSIPEPPKPVPTSSSFDLLSQLFNLNGAQPTPKVIQQQPQPQPTFSSGLGALGGLFESFLPKKQPSNREAAASASNPLLSFFQPPSEPVVTPAPGPYYWFDVNAFLGQDPNAGPMSGIRPKFGTRDYFLKVRKRRNSMEVY